MSGPYYISDCTNVYSDPTDGYPTIAEACQNCDQSLAPTAAIPSNFSAAGSCAAAPATPSGSGYLSDGTNYYVCNPTDTDDCSSDSYAETPMAACMTASGPASVGQCPVSSTESFMLFGKEQNKTAWIIGIVLFVILVVLGIFLYRKYIR